MKKVGAVVLGLLAGFAAVAQDMVPPARPDVIPVAQTNTVPSATNSLVTITNALPSLTNGIEQSISLDSAISEALEHNFDISIEKLNPQIAEYDVRIGYAAYDPILSTSAQHSYAKSGGSGFDSTTGQPRAGSVSQSDAVSASIGSGLLPFGTSYSLTGNLTERYGRSGGVVSTNFSNHFDNTSGSIGVNVTQPLLRNLWINPARLAILVAKNRLKYTEQGLRQRLIDEVTLVEQAYYDLIAARETVKVQRAAMELAQQLLSENKKRVEVGTMAPLDEKQAESQVASSESDLIAAERALTAQENVLKGLISDNYRTVHDVDFVPVESLAAPVQIYDLQGSWANGMKTRPDLLQKRLDLEQQGIQLKYNRNQLFPELDLFGSYGYSAGGANTVEFSDGFQNFSDRTLPFYSYGASMSVPLSNASARNKYKQNKLTVQQALLTLKQFEQSVLIQIDDAVKQAESDYQSVQATRAAREYAEAALDAEQKKLQSGKSTSFVVLQLQKDLTTARSAEISALASYNKSLAALSQAEGSTLDRRGISVRVQN